MIRRNPALAALKAGYLFPEIGRRRRAFQEKNPDAKIISLGVGNTTEPLTPHVTRRLREAAERLGTREGYTGYGDEQGQPELRAAIAEVLYQGLVRPDEVFVSDGAKCDIGRLQLMFGGAVPVAVQDPSYPVYVDGSVIVGAASGAGADGRYGKITYLPCRPQNGFMPDLGELPRDGLVYFCSPNNPTGAVATKKQLAELIAAAQAQGCLIIFDAAYADYIRDPGLPRSIFEVDGARTCAIEVNSFSKPAGFTGVRLGWTVVPRELAWADGSPVIADWNRIMTTIFNGASNLAQQGGLAALEPAGRREGADLIAHYMGNADLIRQGLHLKGVTTYGGDNAPYIWASFPGRASWEVFEEILERCHVVTTPGSGFGPCGEGFVRFSAFGRREDVVEAVGRLGRL